MATPASRSRTHAADPLAQYTSFSLAPVVKKLLSRSRQPLSVTVTFIGDSGSP